MEPCTCSVHLLLSLPLDCQLLLPAKLACWLVTGQPEQKVQCKQAGHSRKKAVRRAVHWNVFQVLDLVELFRFGCFASCFFFFFFVFQLLNAASLFWFPLLPFIQNSKMKWFVLASETLNTEFSLDLADTHQMYVIGLCFSAFYPTSPAVCHLWLPVIGPLKRP